MQRRHALALLALTLGLLVYVLTSDGRVFPLYRFPVSGRGDFAWLTNEKLIQQVSETNIRFLDIQPTEVTHDVKNRDFFRMLGISASPDGKYVAWEDTNWVYCQAVDDLTKPVMPRRPDIDHYPASNTHWLSDGIHYLTILRVPGGLTAALAARDSDHIDEIRLPGAQDPWIRDVRILGETREGKAALLTSQFPIWRGKLRIDFLDLKSNSIFAMDLERPFNGYMEDQAQLALAPPGDRLIWVVRRPTNPTFTARWLGRFTRPPAYEEFVLCSTDLRGANIEIITRFPIHGQNAFCGFVKVSPNGKLMALQVGSELCIYPLR